VLLINNMEGKEAYPKWLIETKKTVGKAKVIELFYKIKVLLV